MWKCSLNKPSGPKLHLIWKFGIGGTFELPLKRPDWRMTLSAFFRPLMASKKIAGIAGFPTRLALTNIAPSRSQLISKTAQECWTTDFHQTGGPPFARNFTL